MRLDHLLLRFGQESGEQFDEEKRRKLAAIRESTPTQVVGAATLTHRSKSRAEAKTMDPAELIRMLLERNYQYHLLDLDRIIDYFRFIKSGLENMSALVQELEHDTERRVWIIRVRDVAYDIEDWMELSTIRRDSIPGIWSNPFRFQVWLCGIPRKLKLPTIRPAANELHNFKVRIDEIRQEFTRTRGMRNEALDTVTRGDRTVVVDPRHHGLYQENGTLVGLARPMEEVTKMLGTASAGGMCEVKTVSIVGMAGSGKTTLAKAVYRRLGEQTCFQCQAFVSVTPKPDLRETLVDMLSQIANEPQAQVDEGIHHLIGSIRELLIKKKRYLIVVDDLWSRQHWEIIECCFPENSLGSKIITTTRNLELARECSNGRNDCIYNVQLLSEVDSKKLILNRTLGFPGSDRNPQYLDDVLPVVTRICGGLPLALLAMARMLAFQIPKEELDWWFIGSKWLSHPEAEVMKQTLNLSYDDLPSHLMMWLLYLSTFPLNNNKVGVDRLARRWIAERVISETSPGVGVEDQATIYLNDLIHRNMVRPLLLNKDGIEYCTLHPVIYDYIVCKSKDENFATLRRLSLQGSMEDQDETQQGAMNLSSVRSVITLGQQACPAPSLANLSVLRVLDLEGCVGPVRLEGLEKLVLLRYLSLKGTDVSEVPGTIGELRRLETLDVRSRLRRTLRNLLFGHEGMINSIETATRIPEDIQNFHTLENVATIDLRVHHASFVKGLSALRRLKVITIVWSFEQPNDAPYCEALLSSIEKWSNLNSLTIQCGLGCSMDFLDSLSDPPLRLEKFKVTAGCFVHIPKWIGALLSLSFLQINLCKLQVEDLDILKGLPKLQCLMLGLGFVPREAIMIETEGFKCLLTLSINCPVPWLTFQPGAMPRLTHLELELCSGSASKESVPCGIGNLQSLTEVVLLYNQEWCGNSSSVTRTVDAVKRQVVNHNNMIDLLINDTKVDYVQEVDREATSTSEVQSGEETVRTRAVETWGEIEIEAE